MTKNNTPLVSILVPIYNVEDYLQTCVKSLLAQSYKNIEILLIDDGSTDKSGQMCDTFAAKDIRIKVIHKRNGGVSDARNTGLKHSTGSLICFVDGDDYVSKDYVSKMYSTMKSSGADIVECGFYRVFGKTLHQEPCITESLSGSEAIRRLLMSSDLGEVVAWGKLYQSKLFLDNSITYPMGKISEDIFTTYKLFSKSEKINFINDNLYYYIQRNTSITGTSFSREHLDATQGADQIISWAEKTDHSLLRAAYAFRARITIFHSGEIYNMPKL